MKEYDSVRLPYAITSDSGYEIPAGAQMVVVSVGQKAVIVEVRVKDDRLVGGVTFDTAVVPIADVEVVE